MHPAPVGFRWHLVRSRPLGGGVSDGLASGSRAGETATPDEPDAYYPRGSPWAWHAHRLDVADALPGDVLSVWAAPDGPEDLARQEAAAIWGGFDSSTFDAGNCASDREEVVRRVHH